jgi:hypothetical protein
VNQIPSESLNLDLHQYISSYRTPIDQNKNELYINPFMYIIHKNVNNKNRIPFSSEKKLTLIQPQKGIIDDPKLKDLTETNMHLTEVIKELVDDQIENNVMQGEIGHAAESTRRSLEEIESKINIAKGALKGGDQGYNNNLSTEEKANVGPESFYDSIQAKFSNLNQEVTRIIDSLTESKGGNSGSS